MVSYLQVACIVSVGMGIGVELWFGANLGFVLITIGSGCFGVATKIHSLEESRERRHNNEE
jgi:hypothetical protein